MVLKFHGGGQLEKKSPQKLLMEVIMKKRLRNAALVPFLLK